MRKSALEEASKSKRSKVGFRNYSAQLSLQDDALINRRFAIIQKGKPRVIDDCSTSSLNASVQKIESPKPQSTDLLGSLCLAMLDKFPEDSGLKESAWTLSADSVGQESEVFELFLLRSRKQRSDIEVHVRIAFWRQPGGLRLP